MVANDRKCTYFELAHIFNIPYHHDVAQSLMTRQCSTETVLRKSLSSAVEPSKMILVFVLRFRRVSEEQLCEFRRTFELLSIRMAQFSWTSRGARCSLSIQSDQSSGGNSATVARPDKLPSIWLLNSAFHENRPLQT
jgi:hypothetical protein